MERPTPFYRRSRISAEGFRQLLRRFALDFTAAAMARLTGLTRESVTAIFTKIRRRVAEESERDSPLSAGEVEVGESYFGSRRARPRLPRGPGKTIVFGVFKRNGTVHKEVVPDCRKRTLLAVIRGPISPGAVTHSNGWRGYNGPVDVGCSKHYRANHAGDGLARGAQHINGIEGFRSFAQHRLQQFPL